MKSLISTLLILSTIGVRAQIAEIEGDLSITSDSTKITFIELLENPTATGILYSKQGDFVIQSLNRDIDIESVRGIIFKAQDDISFFNEDFDFDIEAANVGIEAEKTFELQNDLGVVLNYDSLGRIMINESRQAESDLHINQSGGDGQNEQTGGLNLQNDSTRWRIYSSASKKGLLRFNYSNDDGNTYRPKSFIDWNTGGFFRQIDQASIKSPKASLKYLSKLKSLVIDEYMSKSITNNTPNEIAFNANIAYKLFPQLVSIDKSGQVDGINYAGLSIVAIRAIQEQQEIIDSQANEIDLLNKKNQELENRLIKLESMFENVFKK